MNRPKFKCAFISIVLLACALVWTVGPVAGQEKASGTSSRKIQKEARAAIPFAQLTNEARNKIQGIVQRPSIYRQLPVTSIEVDPDYYLHLVRRPEVVIGIWQLMGVTEMTADRTGEFTLSTNDGAGTIGEVELIYGTNNMHIFYAEGEYRGGMLSKKLRGRCVMVLQTEYFADATGAPQTRSKLDVFLKIENATLNLIAKTLHPLIGPTADHNFVESINFLQRLNETAIKNGPGVQAMGQRLEDLTPEVRREFQQISGLVFDRAQSGVQYGSYSSQSQFQSQQRPSIQSETNRGHQANPTINQNRLNAVPVNFSSNPYQTAPTVRSAQVMGVNSAAEVPYRSTQPFEQPTYQTRPSATVNPYRNR